MKSKQLLKQIIDLVDQLESDQTHNDEDLSLNDLLTYIQSKQNSLENDDRHNRIRIGQNIALMYRYSKFYIKKSLQDSLLQTADEYMYLVELYSEDYLSKTELNNRNVMEKTSGNEVMKRLLQTGLIGECMDKDDKRKRRVFITEKGKEELLKTFPKLWKAAYLLPGLLTDHERGTFLELSDKICTVHRDIFVNHRDDDIDRILEHLQGPVKHD